MKNVNKLIFMALMLITLITSVSVLNVNAQVAPDSITMKSKSSMYYFSEAKGTDYISGYNFYRKELSDGTLGYCVSNINTTVPSGKTIPLAGEITDKGLAYIIQNGYPNKSMTGNDKKDYYITQAAIWEYFDETRGSDNWKSTTFTASSTGMKAEVFKLVQAAKTINTANSDSKASVTVSVANSTMSLNNDLGYFVSDNIKVELKNTVSSYTVKLVNAPAGTKIKSTSGEEKTTFNANETFNVYVKADSIVNGKGSVSLKVESEGVSYKLYYYSVGNSKYQDIAPTRTFEERTAVASNEIVLTYEKEVVTKVQISKKDITNNAELPGATLVVKDKDGNVIDEWVSTTTPHYIEGLKPGDYTLTEKIAPNGYLLSEETITFTVKADGTTTNVVMYNKLKPVVTKVQISKQDIASKEELPGATLVVKDKDGNVIDEWVSTTTPHYIEGLEPGDYTLTEKIAPENYVLSEETITFTVKDDGSITSVVMYNTKYTPDIPKTDLNISTMSMIFATVLITLGAGMVVYYEKFGK